MRRRIIRPTKGTHSIFVLYETLVVTRQADEEENAGDVLEAVYPFSALALLATDVYHQHLVFTQMEDSFCDTNGSCARVNDVLLERYVCGIE